MNGKKERTERKTRKVPEAEFAAFEHSKSELGKEQAKENRKKTIERTEVQITNWKREREHKEKQLGEPYELLEKHDAFLDGKKPKFMLQNEQDIIDQNIKEAKEGIENLKKMEEKND